MNGGMWTKEDHDRLIRIDERTDNLVKMVERLSKSIEDHEKRINKLAMNASYNKGMLKASAAVASFVTSVIMGSSYIILKILNI